MSGGLPKASNKIRLSFNVWTNWSPNSGFICQFDCDRFFAPMMLSENKGIMLTLSKEVLESETKGGIKDVI
ncbi:hypothetical protein CXK86_20070 [Paenibacillus sp. BGI2013]|nr:hypothetical protein CXK86_20070 [Paenibacillus sp. BGI2013]